MLPFPLTGPAFGVVLGDAPMLPARPKWSSDHAGPAVLLPRVLILD